ncbi:MAG: DUF4350 domain-containing protein [Theionarchaea archaeon]|nr:DUF4350 domain-containing protein [Theionarchaea archaeon]
MRQVLVVILLMVGLLAVASIAQSSFPEKTPHSSRNREPPGSLAFYLLMEKYTRVERLNTTLGNLENGTLIIISPVRPLAPEELEYLFGWVEEGNRVVVFSDDSTLVQQFGATLSPTEWDSVILTPLRDHWSTRNVAAIRISYSSFFSSYEGDALFADEGNPVIIEIKKGQGEIFLISDTAIVWNISIDTLDNEVFLVQLSYSGKVYFDEYHLYKGREDRGITWERLKSPFYSLYSSFFIQLLLAIALFLVAYGMRFGTARPVTPKAVQSSELIVSAADLYYKAGKKEILEVINIDKGEKDLKSDKYRLR